MFIDESVIYVKAGDGGNVSYESSNINQDLMVVMEGVRKYHFRFHKSIHFRMSHTVSTIKLNGAHGGSNKIGKSGEDIKILVL